MSSYKIALMLVILCIGILAVQPAASAPPFVLEGSLQVNSVPTGATVYIDGEEMGVTPTTVTNLTLGYHDVILTKTGYQNWGTQAYVHFRQTTSISALLIPLSPTPTPTVTPTTPISPTPTTTISPTATTTPTPTGTLAVFSVPTNAVVMVDNVFAGRTPLFISGVTAGTHRLEVDKEGYHSYEVQVNVQAGSTTTVIANLVQETPTTTPTTTIPTTSPTTTVPTTSPTTSPTTTVPTTTPTTVTPTPTTTSTLTGTLQVFSTPSNATVRVDNVFAGRTPLFLPGVSAGTHKVEVDKEGYHSYEAQVQVQAGFLPPRG